ncbi:MAG: hypothetical protein FWD59_04035 [Micrococcales bacterium]|nr:hypothetical protein [Micrococcales bacterium]
MALRPGAGEEFVMIGRWRGVALAGVVTLALGACTDTPDGSPSAEVPAVTGDPSITSAVEPDPVEAWEMALKMQGLDAGVLPVIEPGDAFPDHVEVPGPAFPDTPGEAPVLSDALPPPSAAGLGLYPIFLDGGSRTVIGFIDAKGKTVVDAVYWDYLVCVGPERQAVAVIGRRGAGSDVLDPRTGDLLWTSPFGLVCVDGSTYAEAGDWREGYSSGSGIVNLVTGVTAVEPKETYSIIWIDSHTIDLADLEAEPATVIDLDTDARVPHPGRVPMRPWTEPLPVEHSRSATLPAVTFQDEEWSEYFSWDGEWSSVPIKGTIWWYDEKTAIVLDQQVTRSVIMDRADKVVAGPFADLQSLGRGLFQACVEYREEDDVCVREGIIDADGNWVVETGDGEQRLSTKPGDSEAPDKVVTFGANGLGDLIDLTSGARTPLPNVGAMVPTIGPGSSCPGFEPDGDASGPGGFITPAGRVVALPDGYRVGGVVTTDRSPENRGCEIVEAVREYQIGVGEDAVSEMERLYFTEDGRLLPPSINVTHSLGPGLNWATWGPYAGYLDNNGRWLYRVSAFEKLVD